MKVFFFFFPTNDFEGLRQYARSMSFSLALPLSLFFLKTGRGCLKIGDGGSD